MKIIFNWFTKADLMKQLKATVAARAASDVRDKKRFYRIYRKAIPALAQNGWLAEADALASHAHNIFKERLNAVSELDNLIDHDPDSAKALVSDFDCCQISDFVSQIKEMARRQDAVPQSVVKSVSQSAV